MKNVVFYLILSFSFLSCKIKDSSTLSYAYIINKSSAPIKLVPYHLGVSMEEHIKTLNNNDSVDAAPDKFIGMGKQKGAGFNSDFMSLMDSLIVVFNNVDSVSHYRSRSLPITVSHKYLTPDSPRCFINLSNWNLEYTEPNKYKAINVFKYTFTEADYEYAKQ